MLIPHRKPARNRQVSIAARIRGIINLKDTVAASHVSDSTTQSEVIISK